jgi:hypothetical protein
MAGFQDRAWPGHIKPHASTAPIDGLMLAALNQMLLPLLTSYAQFFKQGNTARHSLSVGSSQCLLLARRKPLLNIQEPGPT